MTILLAGERESVYVKEIAYPCCYESVTRVLLLFGAVLSHVVLVTVALKIDRFG